MLIELLEILWNLLTWVSVALLVWKLLGFFDHIARKAKAEADEAEAIAALRKIEIDMHSKTR